MQANSSSRTKAICFGYTQTAIQTQRVREDDILPYDEYAKKNGNSLLNEKRIRELPLIGSSLFLCDIKFYPFFL